MLRKLLLGVCAVVASAGCFSQTLTFLEDNASVSYSGISRNGKWAYGSFDQFGSYKYDVSGAKLIAMEDGSSSAGISDAGVLVGTFEGKPAYYKDGAWIKLDVPADINADENIARAISADGKVIVGHLSFNNNGNYTTKTTRKPCMWTLQENGTYSAVQFLPMIETDLTGRRPQALDPLACSESGDVIIGRMVDCSGYFNLPVSWKKGQDNQWQCEVYLKEFKFKEGAQVPTIPELPDLDLKSFFTQGDSVRYQADLDAYQSGESKVNPDERLLLYITNPDSIVKYDIAADKYNKELKIVNEKWTTLLSLTSGYGIDDSYMTISANGKYVAIIGKYENPESGGEPQLLSQEDRYFPILFDLSTGSIDKMEWIESATVDGVTNNGDVFFATPYLELTRSAYVIPFDTKTAVEFCDWVMLQTNGQLNIKPSFTYDQGLITGDVYPSRDGRILMGRFASPVSPQTVVYFVDLDGTQSIENLDSDAAVVYPNPASDAFYIKGNAESVSVLDLTGRTVYQSAYVSGPVSVGMLGEGTYLVKIKVGNETTVHKLSIKK